MMNKGRWNYRVNTKLFLTLKNESLLNKAEGRDDYNFGIWLVNQFHWILYLFGVLMLVTGIKIFIFAEHKSDLAKILCLLGCVITYELPMSFRLNDFLFFAINYYTSHHSFLYLILVEVSDLVFALDSIPAIFAVTNDPFIVFTFNIFAILGLRALYFLLVNMHKRFQLLKYGLAFILIFVGFKMLIAPWFKIPIFIALSVIIMTLICCVFLSIYQTSPLARKK